MWRMLIASGGESKIVLSNISADENQGAAHWEATYKFSQTGRLVVNKIDAKMTFKDGKIIRHVDTFDLHRWAKQALGFKGMLIGGTSFFKRKLNQQTNALLNKFENRK